jgi:hypothetical protein
MPAGRPAQLRDDLFGGCASSGAFLRPPRARRPGSGRTAFQVAGQLRWQDSSRSRSNDRSGRRRGGGITALPLFRAVYGGHNVRRSRKTDA